MMQPKVHNPVTQWPNATSGGSGGLTCDKVPTEIQYADDSNNDDSNNDDSACFKWGFQINESGHRHKWFKLDLDSSQHPRNSHLARDYPDPTAAFPGHNLTSEKLVTDYLTALRKHAERVLHYKLPQRSLQSTRIEYVIKVPAVWKDAAKARTRFCAEHAGMGLGSTLHLISEPEAAATYALPERDPHDISRGDTFVVCDAGGGTVDLISYTVASLRPILEIAEAAPGTGALCGSTFVNRRFKKFLKDSLGSSPDWGDDVLEEADRFFDLFIKRPFSGNTFEEFKVPVPGIRDNAN